jgi:hypothetical protein
MIWELFKSWKNAFVPWLESNLVLCTFKRMLFMFNSESKQMCIHGIFKDDLGFYYFQKRETTISKDDTSNWILESTNRFKYSMGWHNFTNILWKALLLLWHLLLNWLEDINFSLDRRMSKGLEIDQTKVYWNTDIDITKLAGGVSCSYRCILISCGVISAIYQVVVFGTHGLN